MPTRRRAAARPDPLVAVVAYDQLCTFEFGIAVEVFGLPRPELEHWYRFVVAAAEPGPLRAVGGVRIGTDTGLEALQQADTIIVPGWRKASDPVPGPLVEALRQAHARGARLVSLCSGVFVLAATGLLDGRRVTTHWRYFDALAAAHPQLRIVPGVLYVDEGSILTAAGSAAGLDLCLHLVRRDYGPRLANTIAQRLVIAPHREGDQAQLVGRPVPAEGDRLSALLDWARGHLDRALSVDALAGRAGMSRRNFMRRFRDATGATPQRWLTEARLARARDLLELTGLSVEQVATDCGFGSADVLRHHFRARMKSSPSRYRAEAL